MYVYMYINIYVYICTRTDVVLDFYGYLCRDNGASTGQEHEKRNGHLPFAI